jgi:hypothetical protein
MAVEAKRGCGYRKAGGLYMMGSGTGIPCDRLPIPLAVCPTCKHGIKQSRGWTWINLDAMVEGVHRNCEDEFPCPICMDTGNMGEVGLVWIGERFYKTPDEFMSEAKKLGISRRIPAVPRGFEVGKTWVILAHPKAVRCEECAKRAFSLSTEQDDIECQTCDGSGYLQGAFYVFRPTHFEKILTETQAKDAKLVPDLVSRGITIVTVPDNDKDHQGTVYDSEEGEEAEAAHAAHA